VLIAVVSTIIVAVTDPHVRNAGIIVALVLVDRTFLCGTTLLVLTSGTIVGLVALLVQWDTEGRLVLVRRTFELVLEADVLVAVLLVTRVPAIVESVTDLGGVEAMLVGALELTRRAVERGTTSRLVGTVATVVLSITAPPERDALVG